MPRPTITIATSPQPNLAEPSSPILPNPVLTFTIPSIYDDTTTLECRVYFPLSLAPDPRAPPWRKHAAVVAHPYASLGGCYDDAVVESMSAALLTQGFVVGTFNFRGAGRSTGKTSWTAKAERADYMSFVGFVYYYVHYYVDHLDALRPKRPTEARSPTSSTAPISPVASMPMNVHSPGLQAEAAESPVLLLCGYSYGAMITKLLPPLATILEPFATPKVASAAADIRLRAQHLAKSARAVAAPTSPRKAASGALRVGGDEDKRRSQEHGRRSFSLDAEDKIRKGVAELLLKAKSHPLGHHGRKTKEFMAAVQEEGAGAEGAKAPDSLARVGDLYTPRVAYLLVSPPVGWPTQLLTLSLEGFLGGVLGKRLKAPKTQDPATIDSTADTRDPSTPLVKQNLLDNPTLAIYGDSDVFVGAKKFRQWAAKLQSVPGSQFRAHEISTAGHFYVEEGTLQRVADAVKAFASGLAMPGSRVQPTLGKHGTRRPEVDNIESRDR